MEKKNKLSFGQLMDFPRAMITVRARQKLQYFIDLFPEEISGYGKVERRGKDFLITDVFVFKQEVSGSDTELDPRAIARFQYQLIRAGHNPKEIRLWWHSHHNMGTEWSGVDDDTAEEYFRENNYDYMISVVGNKSGEIRCRLDLYKPFSMSVDYLPPIVVFPEDRVLKAECGREIKEKVKRRSLFGIKRKVKLAEGVSEVKMSPDEEIMEVDLDWLRSLSEEGEEK